MVDYEPKLTSLAGKEGVNPLNRRRYEAIQIVRIELMLDSKKKIPTGL